MYHDRPRYHRLADLVRKHIEDQQNRIVRQRELMAKYERDDDVSAAIRGASCP
jgi:hypothetical protein